MSKKYVKTRQTNPNRTRSENNPNRIRNDPQMDWTKYNKGRHSKGQRFVRRMCRIADITRDILGTAPGTRDRRVSTVLMSILKSEENLSYWGLIKHFDRHPMTGAVRAAGPYYTSWYQLRILDIDPALLQKLITRMAGDAVHSTPLVDSSGFQYSQIHGLAECKVRHA